MPLPHDQTPGADVEGQMLEDKVDLGLGKIVGQGAGREEANGGPELIAVQVRGDHVILDVLDDGVGFEGAAQIAEEAKEDPAHGEDPAVVG